MDLRKTAKMDHVMNTELDELKQKKKIKLKNVPEDVFHSEDYYWNGLKTNKNTASDCYPKPYTPKPCSWNGASKEEIMASDLDEKKVAFDLDDKCSETKDREGLDENPQQSINLTHRTSNSQIYRINQLLRYLPMDWSHVPVFDPGGEVGRSH
ncbi:38465_t:CDS:2 [Gigaspora margarita]|uniref:38465_t:CDS:1 n=1 Tax=Gigaspora margarita TaxID=4874 RepID=A0ABN7VQK3_GIGMA|nr:38465_t:CDS:2 [Gigaspora margarita]